MLPAWLVSAIELSLELAPIIIRAIHAPEEERARLRAEAAASIKRCADGILAIEEERAKENAEIEAEIRAKGESER